MKNSELKFKEELKKYADMKSCPVRNVLDRFGDKWSVLILLLLEDEQTLRFNELNREIPDISQKMLTVTLRSLEAEGYISRKVYPEIPPRVEYQLTAMGKSLIPHIAALTKWAKENMPDIMVSRKQFEKKASRA